MLQKNIFDDDESPATAVAQPQLRLVKSRLEVALADESPSSEFIEKWKAPEKTQSIGEKFSDLWKKTVSVFDVHAATMQELRDLEQSILPGESYSCAVDDYKILEMKRELSRGLVNRLVRYAEKRFSPVGGSLSIDISDVRDKFAFDDEKPEVFCLKSLWDHLEQTYGGQAGEDEAWRQTANILIKEFGLKHKKEVIRKAGRTILELNVSIDSLDKKYGGKNKLCYSSQESVLKVLKELKAFATWQQDMGLASDLGKLSNIYSHRQNTEITSRAQHVCGDDQEIILVTFNNKFEFRFSDTCAAQLQLFLSSFGNLNQE